MRTRVLGKTNIRTSILGIGSSPFRHGQAEDWTPLLSEAIDRGVNYYDTAHSYVNGEDAVAPLTSARKERLVVATKTGARGGPRCAEDLKTSLRRMRRDWIDVWMTHMIRTEDEYEQCLRVGGFCDIAFSAKAAGFTRASGASFHAPTSVILRAIEDEAFDVVMFQLNAIGRETVFGSSIKEYRDVLLPAARRASVGVVVMKVLAGGELRWGAPSLSRLYEEDGAGREQTIAAALRYVVGIPEIATSVVGMSSADELNRNLVALRDLPDWTTAEVKRAANIVDAIDEAPCTRCGKCAGECPEAIDIPAVFRLYSQHRYFGMTAAASRRYAALDIRADRCSMCARCEEKCPEEFNVSALLRESHHRLSTGRPER